MQNHFKLLDSEFKKQFISCELSPADFSHEAHIRMAWINIKEYGIEQAEIEMEEQLLRFVDFVGAKDKYNRTVTIAAMKVVNHFIQRSSSDNFQEFINEFPQLINNFKGLITSHYSFDIFATEDGKTTYLKPDLLPFE